MALHNNIKVMHYMFTEGAVTRFYHTTGNYYIDVMGIDMSQTMCNKLWSIIHDQIRNNDV